MSSNSDRIVINLDNGMRLVAARNTDPSYDREIMIYVEDAHGCIYQDLAIVRNSYTNDVSHYCPNVDNSEIEWIEGKFDVMVYGDPYDEDYTKKFTIDLYVEDNIKF